MRRRLILVFLAISTLVAIAFVIPLGFLVRRTAEDRAIDSARADAAAVVPALVSDGTRSQIEAALDSTEAGRDGRLTVITAEGWVIGPEIDRSPRVMAALVAGTSGVGGVPGGSEVVASVALGSGELSAIRVFVPNQQLRDGQWEAWGVLAAVGLILIAISVFVADRLARSIVRPTEDLARAARRLGQGDLDAFVDPGGPDELVDLGQVFNDLGARVESMLERERELVAELSHRLRTPLTKLRMRIDQVDETALAQDLRSDADDLTTVVNTLISEARGALDGSGTCDAVRVVTDRASFWSVLADDQDRPWRFERSSGRLRVPVSAAALAAAVDALLENVFAHTEDRRALTVGLARENGKARIWVADAGQGFDEAAIARGSSGVGSTGLGLDIAQRLAAEAGGSLRIGSSDLGGAEVEILLPLVPAPTE